MRFEQSVVDVICRPIGHRWGWRRVGTATICSMAVADGPLQIVTKVLHFSSIHELKRLDVQAGLFAAAAAALRWGTTRSWSLWLLQGRNSYFASSGIANHDIESKNHRI